MLASEEPSDLLAIFTDRLRLPESGGRGARGAPVRQPEGPGRCGAGRLGSDPGGSSRPRSGAGNRACLAPCHDRRLRRLNPRRRRSIAAPAGHDARPAAAVQARAEPERPAIFHATQRWRPTAGRTQREPRAAFCAAPARARRPVVVCMRNHPRYPRSCGCVVAGLAVVPVNAKLHPAEVEWIVGDAQAQWAFVTRDAVPQPLAGIARQVDAESAEADAAAGAGARRAGRTACRARARRPGLALLHQRHDWPSGRA